MRAIWPVPFYETRWFLCGCACMTMLNCSFKLFALGEWFLASCTLVTVLAFSVRWYVDEVLWNT